MPEMIQTKDKKNHTLFDNKDIFDLIDEYMGMEARDLIRDWISDIKAGADAESMHEQEEEMNKFTKQFTDKHKKTFDELHKSLVNISELISEQTIDRKKLSDEVGRLSIMISREQNRKGWYYD